MFIGKFSRVFFIALACTTVQASPILQLGVTNGSFDSKLEDVITTDRAFSLNAFGKASKNGIDLNTNYYISIAILADDKLDPANFGSFNFAGINFTGKDMVFGNPPFEKDQGFEGGDLSPHGIFDTWFLQYAFKFNPADKTADVNTEKSPGFKPTDNAGKDYFFKSFTVDTKGLFAGYNLHFDLFSTEINKKGNVVIGSNAPFSHDVSTAYVALSPDDSKPPVASIPEPSSFLIFALALGVLVVIRKVKLPTIPKLDL